MKVINLNFLIQMRAQRNASFPFLATVLFVSACRLVVLCGGDSNFCVFHWPRLRNHGNWIQKETNQGN